MAIVSDLLQLCRLCLVKDEVNVPIFEGESDDQQISLKISSCLPVTLSQDDRLPQKICSECCRKLDTLYEFRNSSVNAEKQLVTWLEELENQSKKTSEKMSIATESLSEKTIVKEEIDEVDENGALSNEAEDYILQQQVAYDKTDLLNDAADETGEPQPKRAKRAAALKALIHTQESEEDEEDIDEPEPITKAEEESEPSETDINESVDDTFAGGPSTSADDQPGPSGVGKSTEGPDSSIFQIPIITIKEEIDLEENKFLEFNEVSALAALEKGKPKKLSKAQSVKDIKKTAMEKKILSRTRNLLITPKSKNIFTNEEAKNLEKNNNALKKTSKKPTNKSKQKSNEINDTIKYQCPTCKDEQRRTVKELRQHYKNDHMGKRLRTALLSNEMHPCDICGKEFKNGKALREHMKIHNDSYTCEECGVSHKKALDYVLHLRLHSDEGVFKCIFCEYVTQDVNEITSHCNNLHQTMQKFHCTICNKSFSLYSWFVEHDNYHTGKKPFGCEYCGKYFFYSRYLSAHRNNMHKEELTGSSNFHACVICKKQYRRKKYLTLHMNSHTGNFAICDVCGKTLASKEKLKFHMRTHTGYKPYSCSYCEKCFIRRPSLVEHIRIHTGERPYVCEHCNKGFSQRTSLVIHIRSHTGERPYVCHICQKGFVAKAMLNIHLKACKGYDYN